MSEIGPRTRRRLRRALRGDRHPADLRLERAALIILAAFAACALMLAWAHGAEFQVNVVTSGTQTTRWGLQHCVQDGTQTKVAFIYAGDVYGRMWDATTGTFTTSEVDLADLSKDGNRFGIGCTSNTQWVGSYLFGSNQYNLAKDASLVDTSSPEVGEAVSNDAEDGSYFLCGNNICVWTMITSGGSSDVYAIRYDSVGTQLGAEFTTNTTVTGNQQKARIAIDPSDDDFVVVWNDENPAPDVIRGQRFASTGTAIGTEFTVASSVTAPVEPSIDVLASGGLIAVWSTAGTADGSEKGVFGRRFDSSGAALGSEFQINVRTLNDQGNPVVKAMSSGGFYVWWNSEQFADANYEVMGRQFDSSGNPVGAEFQVNTYTTNVQGVPDAFRIDDARFVVAWRSFGQDGSDYGIFASDYGNNPYGVTPTQTETATATGTATQTATVTATATSTATSTATPTATETSTSTVTQTGTATETPTRTSTNTNTETPTSTATRTPTSTPTQTPRANRAENISLRASRAIITPRNSSAQTTLRQSAAQNVEVLGQ